jgi:hypothetical protein
MGMLGGAGEVEVKRGASEVDSTCWVNWMGQEGCVQDECLSCEATSIPGDIQFPTKEINPTTCLIVSFEETKVGVDGHPTRPMCPYCQCKGRQHGSCCCDS